MDDELAKVSDATAAPAAEILPETAPEAGTDVYLGPDGKPLAKAAENVADEPLAKRDISTETRADIPAADFAGKGTSFPIKEPGDVAAAASSIGRAGPGNYSSDQLKNRIVAIAKRKGAAFVAKLPKAWQDATAKASETGDLAKSAAGDVAHATMVLNCINELIESEAAEGEADDVAFLTGARAGILAFIGSESEEVGTPEDVADAAEEAAEAPVMAMASKGGDLGREAITAIVEEVLAKRAGATPIVTPPAAPDPEPTAAETPDVEELLRKTTSYIDEQFSRYVSRPELEAMKGEVLGALTPMSEALAKIARFPAPGGPLRFATDADRFAESDAGPANEAEVLAKASRATSDPHLREELGRLAAAAQIAADRKATP
jgi:hypothetical protein